MVDAVIDIIENEGEGIRKYNAKLNIVLLNALGYHENSKRQERTKEQINQLELQRLRR